MKHKNIPKWLILPVLFLLVVGLFVPCIASADPATAVTVEPASNEVGIGETFTVDIFVDPDTDIVGAQFSLSFDASLVTANDVTEGNLLSEGGASTYFISGIIDNVAGTIIGVVGAITTSGETVSQSGTFATISFTAGTAVGTSALDLSNVIVGDLQGQAVDITVTAGSVTVTGTAAEYVLTMVASPPDGGTATDETGASPYEEGDLVNIKAEAVDGYEFVGWTAPAGTFDDEDAAETTFTIPAQDVTVTANFELEGAPPVDGTDHGISRAGMVALWIAVGAAIIVGISLLVRRRRRATR